MAGPSNNDNSDNSNKKPKGGRLYFTKPDTLRVVAIQDPTGKRNLASNRIPSLCNDPPVPAQVMRLM